MNKQIGSSRFDYSGVRPRRSMAMAAGMIWALCATHPASAKDQVNGPKADARSGVRLIRQVRGSGCRRASRDYDPRGVWTDAGCQAEVDLSGLPSNHRDGIQTRTVGVGADISVRNNEAIDVQKSEGQAFSGAIYEDVVDEKGDVAIPKGSYAKLIVRNNSDQFLAVDLELVEVNGMRYEVITDGYRMDGDPRGLETKARTGNVVDGAKLVGAFTQLLSPGRTGKIPAQSFLTFHLERSLALGSGAEDFTHRGQH
jgi:hypothetical protein